MFNIDMIDNKKIRNTQYKHDYANGYVIKLNEVPIAYAGFTINDDAMYLDMIEVIEKEMGTGTKIVQFLIEYYKLKKIHGFVLNEERAFYFWLSLGADIYYLAEYDDVEEFLDTGLESPFELIVK